MSLRGGHDDDEVHALAGAYALDALSDVERAAFERHLAGCQTCAEEVAGLSATAARLGATAEADPPPGLRTAVLSEVSRTRQLRPLLPSVAGLRPRHAGPRLLRVAAAVLLVVTAGLAAALAISQDRLGEQRARAEALERLVADPEQAEVLALTGGGRLQVLLADDRALVALLDAPELPEDRTYQLWLLPPSGDPVSAGLLGDARHAALVEDVDDAAAVAVSVEPAGGSRVPTTEPVGVVPLRS